jgi:aldehyde:ferredoxin oxidoreductase
MFAERHILRVDLTSGQICTTPVPAQVRRQYLGGEGINDWLLWQHFLDVDPYCDPMGPDNVLIAGLGLLGGTGFGGGGKMKWTFKSPAYHTFGDSTSGGFFGAMLRQAGYDHLVITGKAPEPVVLWIEDERVTIRDARHLWGKDVAETNRIIQQELGEGVETACIGPAAERGVTFGAIVVSGHRFAGRAGAGTVMASKNLKAIAVRGTRGIAVYDPARFLRATTALVEAQNGLPARARNGWKQYGTLLVTGFYQRLGVNAYRNNQASRIPEDKYQALSHRWYAAHMGKTHFSCSPGCLWACGGGYQLKQAIRRAGLQEEGYKPEYVIIASFGAMCDIADLPVVAHLGDLCRLYGMDALEAGACLAFLCELWQRGIIRAEDTRQWVGEPLTLEWGNHAAAEKVVLSLGRQENELGRILKGGVYRAALRLEEIKGVPVRRFALYGKGGSPFIEEVRHTPSWALNMAVSPRGACHLRAYGTLDKVNRADLSQYYFATPEGAQPLSTTLKGASSAVADNHTALINSLGLCHFLNFYDVITYPLELFTEALYALTGMRWSPEELLRVGERAVNLEKAFNARLGYRREDDQLCHRWLREEIAEGPGKGWKAEDYLEQLKDEYYTYHGWDVATSLPTRAKLVELGMADVAEVLQREGALGEGA